MISYAARSVCKRREDEVQRMKRFCQKQIKFWNCSSKILTALKFEFRLWMVWIIELLLLSSLEKYYPNRYVLLCKRLFSENQGTFINVTLTLSARGWGGGLILDTFMKKNLESVAKVRQSACLLGTFSWENDAVLLDFVQMRGGEVIWTKSGERGGVKRGRLL